jgi:hypothetical protein
MHALRQPSRALRLARIVQCAGHVAGHVRSLLHSRANQTAAGELYARGNSSGET